MSFLNETSLQRIKEKNMRTILIKFIWPFAVFSAVFFCFCLNPTNLHAKSIRTVEIGSEKIDTVRTAIGYSTIIEFPEKPLSAVLGDQDAFKLEYIGKSITVKPLIPHAKSNLFIFTDHDRFNCTLQTVSPAEVDYLVRMVYSTPLAATAQNESKQQQKRVPKRVDRSQVRNGFGLHVLNYTKILDVEGVSRAYEIKFEIFSKKRSYNFSGQSFGLKQGSEFLSIESLFLSSARIAPGEPPVQGKILVLSSLVSREKPLQVVFAVPSDSKSKERTARLAVNIWGGGAVTNKGSVK